MSFLSVGTEAQKVQLKVQELILKVDSAGAVVDPAVMQAVASTAVINVGQTVGTYVSAMFFDNSAGTIAMIPQASAAVSGSTITLTLAAALAANDSIRLCFTV